MLYAVIMAGGSGTRLWPLSRKGLPKQALRLIGERTMFQHAVDRLAPLFAPDRICVVTNAQMAEVLAPQAPEIPPANFIIEPAGRDSAPAAGLAAVHLLRRDPDATMVILTADHYVVDRVQFRLALAAAAQVAGDGTIVTLGIEPTYPATGFGWIQLGEADTIVDGFRVYHSGGFKEKPDLMTAGRFLEDGHYVWNSGMFVWRADRLMREIDERLPHLSAALAQIGAALERPDGGSAIEPIWRGIDRVSIDFGIMEHAARVSVIPVDIGWSDIGSWGALLDVLPGDEMGNVVDGNWIARDSTGCFVRSSDRLVAAIGLRDMVIVDTEDVLLVCPRARAEEVRELVKLLDGTGRTEYL